MPGQLIDEVRYDPRSSESLRYCPGLKKQPRRLKVFLGETENTELRLLQLSSEPLCPRFAGADMLRDEDVDCFFKEILQERFETECCGFAALA